MTYVNKERSKSGLTGFFIVLEMLRCVACRYQGGGLTLRADMMRNPKLAMKTVHH